MKKLVYVLAMMSILSVSALAQTTGVFNGSSGVVFAGTTYLQATLVNQDPSPADPGAYVNLLFKIENRGTDSAVNTTVELTPEYPFSLDSGVSAITQIGTVGSLQNGNNAFLVRYKVRVDNNAINGDNEIKLKYSIGDGSASNIVPFNISVSNPRTDFDVVAQDASTLVIINIGANTAQSVIVRIPNQQNFRANGTSASVIGNLNAGDYTLASFQLFPIRLPNATDISSESTNLTVEISYTDTLGIRRAIDKEVPFGFSLNALGNSTGRAFQRVTSPIGNVSNGLLYIIIGVVGIVVVVAVLKLRSRKRK